MTIHVRLVYLLYICIGFITDFSETAEMQWYQQFDLDDIQLFQVLQDAAWSPIRLAIGGLSDLIKRQMSRLTQIVVNLFLPGVAWAMLFNYVDHSPSVAVGVMVALLALAEFAPANMTVILDGYVLDDIQSYGGAEMTVSCHRYRMLGKIVAVTLGGWVLDQTKSVKFVFLLQLLAICTTYLYSFVLRLVYEPPPQTPEYETVKDQEEVENDDDGKDNKERQMNWGFVLFMTIFCAIPTQQRCFLYFAYGPLQFSNTQIATIDALSSMAAILATFSVPMTTQISLKWLAYWCSVTITALFLLRYAIVSGLTRYHHIDDYYSVMIVCVVNKYVEGVLWSRYSVASCEHVSRGNEAYSFAKLQFIPAIGKLAQRLIDRRLTQLYGVNHDTFDRFPEVLAICAYGSAIPTIFATLLVRGV